MIMAGLWLSLPAIHAQSYSINGFKVAGGGGSSSNSQYSVSGRIGQSGSSVSIAAPSNVVITWSNPANIGYGTPLGASQLNATANVPGSFAYNPPAGTVLPAGSKQVLSVTFTPADTTDYNVATDSVTVDVLKAPLTITANNTNKLYGAGLPALAVSYAGFTNGDTAASLTIPASVTTTATASSPAGAYPITASAAVDPNYAISYVNGALTVSPAPLTITANNQSKLYGAALPVLTVAYSGFVNGDTAASLTIPPSVTTTATASSPVGAYPITASAAVDPNYAISYVNGALTVSPAPLTITANNQSKLYGAALPVLTVAYSGFVNGDTAASLTTPPSVTTTATASSPAGAYSITASGAVDPNYATSYVNGTLTVSPAPLTITANNQSKLYGAALPALTAAYSGFVNGDTATSLTTSPKLTTTATANSPAGTYSITASGAVDSNYAISYVNGTLTVSKAPLTITANNQTMTQGSKVPTLTASYSGFVNGDTSSKLTTQPTLTTTATSRSAPGSYPIDVSGATSPNYTITFVDGVMTVTARKAGTLAAAPANNSISAAQSNVSGALTASMKSVTNSKAVTIPAHVEIERLAVSPGGQVQLTLSGQPGQAYLLEMSTDLIHWQALKTGLLPNAPFVFVDPSAAGSSHRYYRVSAAR